MGILQTFDASFDLAPHEDRTLPDVVYDGFKVKSIEVEHVYAAGGSTATVEIVYTDDVEPGTLSQLAQRSHQPDMEIRVDQTHRQPPDERRPVPDSIEDMYPQAELVESGLQAEANLNLEEIFGDKTNIVPESVAGVMPSFSVGTGIDEDILTGPESNRQVTTTAKRTTIFTGKPIQIVGKQDDVVEIKLIDNRLLLNRNFVSLGTKAGNDLITQGAFTHGTPIEDIATDLLTSNQELGFDLISSSKYRDSSTDRRGNTYAVISDEIDTEPKPLQYGLEEPISLFRVMSDLAIRASAHFFIDRYNNFRFEVFPETQHFIPAYVTDVEAGNEEDPNNVLVSSPFDDTGVQFFGSTSSKSIGGSVEFDDVDGTRVLSKNNIKSAEEAEKHALSDYMTDLLSRNYGTITLLGRPSISIYDGIVLGVMPELSPVQNGLYMSKAVRHRINASDGFVTEIDLGENLPKMYNKLKGANKAARERSNQISEGSKPLWVYGVGEGLATKAVQATGDQ